MIYWVEIIRKEMKTRVNQRKHPIKNIQAGLYLLTVIDGEKKSKN
jgi:hypothetical protein